MTEELTHAQHVAVELSCVSRFPIDTQDLRLAETAIATLRELGWSERPALSAETVRILKRHLNIGRWFPGLETAQAELERLP